MNKSRNATQVASVGREPGFNPKLLGLIEAVHELHTKAEVLETELQCDSITITTLKEGIDMLRISVARLVGESVVNGMWNILNERES